MGGEAVRVLLVEDDSVDAALVRRLLGDGAVAGFARAELEHLQSLEPALDRVGKGGVDVVLLDLHLSDSDGISTVARLREHEAEVPIVVFTASHDETTALGALQAGAQDYIVKDELREPSILWRVLHYAMERRRIAREKSILAERLARTERVASLGVLAGGLAAGLNRLLGTVLEETDAAVDVLGARPPRGALRRLTAIRKSTTEAARLVEKLRDYAGGHGAPAPQCLDLAEFVCDASSSLDVIADPVQVDYDVRPGGPVVRASRLQLYQVLVAVLRNASEAIGSEEGHVHVSTGLLDADAERLEASVGRAELAPGVHAVLRVDDEGRGLDPELRERIFEPFFTTKSAGRGLGLAAALGIVSELGGRIHVESARGEGSSFSVLLPLA